MSAVDQSSDEDAGPGCTDEYVELDKIEGFWVITAWLADGIVLRLKIEHVSDQDPIRILCEARIGLRTEFLMLQVVETSSYELEHPKECGGQVFERFPEVWREPFWDSAWGWVEISNAISMAPSLFSR